MRPNWFVGWPVAATDWLEGVVADAPAFLRRVPPSDLHVTIAFLGGVEEADATRAWNAIAGETHPPLSVRLAGLEPMGNPRRPTALSVLLAEGNEEAARYMGSWGARLLDAAGKPPSRRPPKPHLTVLRPPRRAVDADRKAMVTWARAHRPIGTRLTLSEVALYTWSDRRSPLAPKFRMVQRRLHGGGGIDQPQKGPTRTSISRPWAPSTKRNARLCATCFGHSL